MKMKKTLTVCLLAVLIAGVGSAQGTILFSEDFESFAAGSNLNSQGGWSGLNPGGGASVMIVDHGAYLTGSQVLNGQAPQGDGWVNAVGHAVTPLLSTNVSVLHFDAYATTTPLTFNTGVGLGAKPNPFGADPQSFMVYWYASETGPGWVFDTRLIGGDLQLITGGYDEPVHLQIVIDGPANETYGIIEGAALGRIETAHRAVSVAQIESLDAVSMFVDNNLNREGAEYDNLLLVPEPTTLSLLALGGLALLRRRR